jgi:hypothetical protein
MIDRRRISVAAAALAAMPWMPHAVAQPPARRYAALSQVGEKVHVVGAAMQTGSSLDRNRRESLKLAEGGLDRNALIAIRDFLKKRDPATAPDLLYTPGVDLCASRSCVESGRFTPPRDLAAELKSGASSHLILVTPHRAEAQLRFADTTAGRGRIEGLGIYLDGSEEAVNLATRTTATGWMGLYAYVKLQLIDVAAATLLRETTFQESEVHTNTAGSGGGNHPWDALTNAQKLERLDHLLRRGIERSLPELLA